MNKKCTLLAAALMMAGTFTANAAVDDDEWTAGNYYYLKAGSNFLSLDGSNADSVIVKTFAADPTKAAIDSALWQIANKQSALGVTSYQITNKATGQLLSFAASATADLNLAPGVDRWVILPAGITGYYGANMLSLSVSGSDLSLLPSLGATAFAVEAPDSNYLLNADELGNGFSVFQLMFGDTYEGNIFAGKQLLAKDLSGADEDYVSLQFQGDETFPGGKAKLLGIDTTKTVISGAQGAYGAKFKADSTYAMNGMHTIGNADFQKFKFTVNLKNDSLAMFVMRAPNVNAATLVSLTDTVRVVFAQVGATKVLTVSTVDANGLPLQGAFPMITASKGTPTTIPTGSGVYFMKSASKGANGGKYIASYNSGIVVMSGTPSVYLPEGQWYVKENNGKYSIVDRKSDTEFTVDKEAFAVQGMANTYTFGNSTDSVTLEFKQVDLNNKYLGSMHYTENELSANGYVLNLVSGTSGVNNIYAYTTDSILKGKAGEASDAAIFKLIAFETTKVAGAQSLGDTISMTSYKLRGQFDNDTIAAQSDSLKFSKAVSALPFTFISDATGKMYAMMPSNDMYVGVNVSNSCLQVSDKVAYVMLTAVEAPEYGSFDSGHKRLMNNNNSLVMNPLTFFAQLKSEGNPILKADYNADNFSLWVEQDKMVDGKQLYFISSGLATKADAATRYYLAAKRDTMPAVGTATGTYAMFMNNDTIKTMQNSPALFAFKTAEQGGYYLENQKELKANSNPYVGVVNGFAVLQANPDPNAAFVVETAEAPTSNEQVSVSDITVISNDGQIIVANASGRKITVSNILGQMLSTRRASSDHYSVPASKGIILVTVEGDNTYKVIVK